MEPHRSTPATAWTGWSNVALGAWLVISPAVLGYGAVRAALWNDLLLGTLVIIAGRAAASGEAPAASWANVLFGLWLIASPFMLGYGSTHHPAAAGNNIVFGLAIAGLGVLSALFYYPAARRRMPGV